MTALVMMGDVMLRVPSARVARGDTNDLLDMAEALAQAKRMRDDAARDAADMRAQGLAEGRAEAAQELRGALNEALEALADGLAAENARRESAVAAAALKVGERLIGLQTQTEIVTGLARQALAHTQAGAVKITVGADLGPEVASRLGDRPGLNIVEDAGAPPFACRIETDAGRIIADLGVQLDTLAKRWGVTRDG